jgi:hypothetical protein
MGAKFGRSSRGDSRPKLRAITSVRYRRDELEGVIAAAKASGVTPSAYMRKAVLSQVLRDRGEDPKADQ